MKNIKIYKIINITLLLICVYLIFFPLFSIFLEKFIPSLNVCVYKEVTGQNCPLYGATRFFSHILKDGFNLSEFSSPFFFMFIGVLIDFVTRCFLLSHSKIVTTTTIIIDLFWHLFLVSAYFTYIFTYFI